jgi:hypothetical protein
MTIFKSIRHILILMALFAMNNVYSQVEFSPYSEYGVKVGAYPFGAYMIDSINTTSLNGKLLGVRLLHVEQKGLGIIAECNYNSLSYNKDNTNIKYDFVQIPFLASFIFHMGNGSVALNAGTYGQFFVSKDPAVYLDKNFLYGLSAGLGLNIPIKKVIIGAETRYYFNLPSSNSEDETMRSKWFEFSVHVSFQKKKTIL